MIVFDILLRLIGAFYILGGVVAALATLRSALMDEGIAAITLERPSFAERFRSWWLAFGAVVVFAGGVLLLVLSELAAFAFALSAFTQAAYLAVIAPRWLDPDDAPDADGRRQTTNAFLVYLGATALVIAAVVMGRLHSWEGVPAALRFGVVLAVLAFIGYVLRNLFWRPR